MKLRSRSLVRFVPLFSIVALMSGCITQSGFPNRIAEASCSKFYECSKTAANLLFKSEEKCVQKLEEDVYGPIVDDCKDWDGKRAAKCIDNIEDRECGSLKIDLNPCEDLTAICK